MSKTAKIEKKESKFATLFKTFTECDIGNFKSMTNLTEWLHRPVDGAALGVFRILFGLAMLVDIAEERGGSQIDLRFGDSKTCHFPLFQFIQAFSFPVMGVIYFIMWLGALGIFLGYKFSLSCSTFVISYWYLFLLEKPAWNNHSYLFGLCGILLMMTKSNRYCSLDSLQMDAHETSIPYWNYFLIKFQFFILYTYAGLKKLSAEWLSGYAMKSLGYHWLFTPVRAVLSVEMTELLLIHWFTAIFDFCIAFFMTIPKTRLFATPFMISFHLMNSRLFTIGMFPWVCLAEMTLFFGFSWPREIKEWIQSSQKIEKKTDNLLVSDNKQESTTFENNTRLRKRKQSAVITVKNKNVILASRPPNKVKWTNKLRSLAILSYCCVQLFLPYSHFITKGYNNWTNGLYGYSWDMMIHSYDTVLTSVKIVDNNNGKVHYLEPFAFTQYDRWTKSADMAVQYAKCIKKNIITEMSKNPRQSPLSSTNISIYFDIWCSLNGRFQQRIFDPTIDLLQASWSTFKRTTWSLPLLNELNHMRPNLRDITDDVLSWSNYSDVIFVADFPGLTLENFVSDDLSNVTLKVIEGSVTYRSGNFTKKLRTGNTFFPNPGETHYVTTRSQPSCYLYTYVNRTMEKLKKLPDTSHEKNDLLPLRKEFLQRITNYKKFVFHIFNSLMFLVHGVPIPMAIREV